MQVQILTNELKTPGPGGTPVQPSSHRHTARINPKCSRPGAKVNENAEIRLNFHTNIRPKWLAACGLRLAACGLRLAARPRPR